MSFLFIPSNPPKMYITPLNINASWKVLVLGHVPDVRILVHV
jgi:hypothetical protein